MTVPWCCFSGLLSISRHLCLRDRRRWASPALWFNLLIRAWFPFWPFRWRPRWPARHRGPMSRNTSYHYSPCTIPKPFENWPSFLVLYQLCCQWVRRGSSSDHLGRHSQWSHPSIYPRRRSSPGLSNRSTGHSNQLLCRRRSLMTGTSLDQLYPKFVGSLPVHRPGSLSSKSRRQSLASYSSLPSSARIVEVTWSCRRLSHQEWLFSKSFFSTTYYYYEIIY